MSVKAPMFPGSAEEEDSIHWPAVSILFTTRGGNVGPVSPPSPCCMTGMLNNQAELGCCQRGVLLPPLPRSVSAQQSCLFYSYASGSASDRSRGASLGTRAPRCQLGVNGVQPARAKEQLTESVVLFLLI